MGIVVQKFGGTSVAGPQRIKAVAERIVATVNQGHQVVAVVSAQGHTTDELLNLAGQISSKPPRRELDMLLATGEQISISLLAMAIDALGYPVISLTGAQGGILTDERHTKAKIREIDCKRIHGELHQGRVVIVAGFQGVSNTNDITTLGRGGSDTTAVAVAAALHATVCEIYTDVEGVYTADPRVVPTATKLREIGYGEMLEMASLGAMVLQPRAVEVAAIYGVEIHVRSSFSAAEGTIVKKVSNLEKEVLVTGVTSDSDCAKVVLVDIPDSTATLYNLFSRLANEGINVDMIVQTSKEERTTDLTFTVTRSDLQQTVEVIDGYDQLKAAKVLIDEKVAKVSIVGAGMMSNPGVAASMFQALCTADIPIQLVSTSEIKVSCLIPRDRVNEATQACHAKFELEKINQLDAVNP